MTVYNFRNEVEALWICSIQEKSFMCIDKKSYSQLTQLSTASSLFAQVVQGETMKMCGQLLTEALFLLQTLFSQADLGQMCHMCKSRVRA